MFVDLAPWLTTGENASVSCRLGVVGSPPPQVALQRDGALLRQAAGDESSWNAGAELWSGGVVTWSDIGVDRQWHGSNLTCQVVYEMEDSRELSATRRINVAFEPSEVGVVLIGSASIDQRIKILLGSRY